MNYYTRLTVAVLIFLIAGIASLSGQGANTKQKEIGLSFGISKVRSFDQRYSAITKAFSAPTFGFYSRSYTDNYRHDFVLNYTLRSKVDTDAILDYRMHRPDFYYSLQRKTDFGWIGGHINFSTLLTFPAIRSGHYNNSPISYTIASSLGPSVSVDNTLGAGSKWSYNGEAHLSLINYVIRPSYGHPYPDDFLESGVFTPTRQGMAPKLASSGKLKTINKYQSIKVRFGIYYLINSSIKVGMIGNLDYVNYSDQKAAAFLNSTMSLSASYIY